MPASTSLASTITFSAMNLPAFSSGDRHSQGSVGQRLGRDVVEDSHRPGGGERNVAGRMAEHIDRRAQPILLEERDCAVGNFCQPSLADGVRLAHQPDRKSVVGLDVRLALDQPARSVPPDRIGGGRPGQDEPDQPGCQARRIAVSPLALARRERAQPQRVEADEALGVLLVVGAAIVLEGHQRVRIERFRRFAAGDDDVALVELQPDRRPRRPAGSCRSAPAASRAPARTRSRCRSARHSAASARP